jgi:pilus assembly protein FimV
MLDAGAQTWASTPPRSGPTAEADQGGPAQWPSSDSEDLDLDLDALKTFGLGGDGRLPPAELDSPATTSSDASGRLPPAGSDDDLGAGVDPGGDDDWALAQGPAESTAWDESATKMDLARAYMAMEDPSAARTILEEVVQEGNAAQKAEAKALIETLG